MADGSRNQANIIAVIGASGSGKSAWIKQQLRAGKPRGLLVWDPQDEFDEFGRPVSNMRELVAAIRDAPADGYRLVYKPGMAFSTYGGKFDVFCQLAYMAKDGCVVVDELGDVTEPSRAPDGWSILSRKGRHQGITLFGAAQRPANIDKDFVGNASLVHCSRLSYENDVKVMANALGVPADEIRNMKADETTGDFDWIERAQKTGAVRRGKLTF